MRYDTHYVTCHPIDRSYVISYEEEKLHLVSMKLFLQQEVICNTLEYMLGGVNMYIRL